MAQPTQPNQSSEFQSTAIDLPHPRSRESPRFSGKPRDLCDFLFDFQLLIERHHLTEEECFFHIIRYVVSPVRDTITGMVEYQGTATTPRSWKTFLKAFQDLYDFAKTERKYTIKDLTRFIDKTRHSRKFTSLSDYNRYMRRFLRIAGWLAARKKVDLEINHRNFWLGLPKATQKKLEDRILQKNPTIDRTVPYSFATITEAAEHIFDDTVFYDAYASDSDDADEHKPTRKINRRKKKYDTDSEDSDSDLNSSDSDDTDPEDAVSLRKYQRMERLKKEKEKEKEKEKGKEKEKERKPKKTPQTRTPQQQYTDLPLAMDVDEEMDEVPGLIGKLQNMRLDDPAYAGTWFTIIRRAPDMKDYLDPPLRRSAPTPTPRSFPSSATAAPSMSYACYFCGEQGHGTRRCPKAEEMVNAGKISRNDQGRIAWVDGTTVSRNRDETLYAAVQRQLATSTNPIPVKRTNVILATSLPAPQEPDSDDASYTEDRSEGYVCRIKKAYPVARAKEERRAERKQVRFEGVFPPGRPTKIGPPGTTENTLPPQPLPTPASMSSPAKATKITPTAVQPPGFNPYDSDEVMEDIEHIQAPHHRAKDPRPQVTKTTNPNPKQKKTDGPKMQTSLGRQVDVNSLVRKVLGTPLSISLGDFLGSAPHCSKILKDYLTVTRPTTLAPTETPVGKTNLIADPSDVNYLRSQYLDRSTVLISLKVSFDNGVTTKALIDPGSEMDLINPDTWMAIQTPMDPSAKLVMEDAGMHFLPLQGVCRNVKLKAGDLSTTADLWVARIAFPLLLGRPWQRRNKISIEEKKSGTWLCHRGPGDQKLWQICAIPAKNSTSFLNEEGDHPGNPITLDDYFHQPPPRQVFQIRKQGQDPDNPILVDEDNPELPFPDDGYLTEQGDLSDEN